MSKDTTIAQVADILQANNNFLIFTHVNPDGDALGSSFSMLNALRNRAKSVDLYIQNKLPKVYSDIFTDDYYSDDVIIDFSKYDYFIFLDTSNEKRIALPSNLEFDKIKQKTINIDHHIDNSNFADTNYITESAACAEICFDILNFLRCDISAQIATYIMAGVIADTGCFRFNNTNSTTMKVAAKLLELGAEYQKIIINSFFSKPIELIKLEADLIHNSLQLEYNGKFAWCYLDDNLLSKYNINLKDIDGLIDAIRAIKGVEIALLITKRDESFKLSFRSKTPTISVGKIARALDGGGHELAAGATVNVSTLEELMTKVNEQVSIIL